jgi:hypothetical protein
VHFTFNQEWNNGTIAYRDKRVVGVFVRFRAPFQPEQHAAPVVFLERMAGLRNLPTCSHGGEPFSLRLSGGTRKGRLIQQSDSSQRHHSIPLIAFTLIPLLARGNPGPRENMNLVLSIGKIVFAALFDSSGT